MLVNTEFVVVAKLRALSNGNIVIAWIGAADKNWDNPYHIKKAISTDGGATWNTTQILASVPFDVYWFSFQNVAITKEGNIWYYATGPKSGHPGEYAPHVGFYDGTWHWTELDSDLSVAYYHVFNHEDHPYLRAEAMGGTGDGILYFNGTTWGEVVKSTEIEGILLDNFSISQDGTIYAVYTKSTGHVNAYDIPDQFSFYFSKKIGNTWTPLIKILDGEISQWGVDCALDAYNNFYYMLQKYDAEDSHPSNSYIKIDNLDRVSAQMQISDGSQWGDGVVRMGCYFPSPKVYFAYTGLLETWDTDLSHLRIIDSEGSWSTPIEFDQQTDYDPLDSFPADVASDYNGWMVLHSYCNWGAPTQPQRLEFFKGTAEPSSMTRRQKFEARGKIVCEHEGICEQNIGFDGALNYWRSNGFPNIASTDIDQVAVYKNKTTGLNEIKDITSNFNPASYDFVGLFWRNRLLLD